MTAPLSIEERLTRLEDGEAIRQIVARYGRGADRHNDPEVLRELYEPDGVLEAPHAGRFEGIDAIIRATSAISRDIFTWTLHYMVSPVIEIGEDGRTARCRWHLWELMQMRQPDGALAETWLGGVYDGRLRKGEDGRWRIAHLLLQLKLRAKVGDPWPGDVEAVIARDGELYR